MSDLNDVKLFGRVVRDAELRHTENNLSFASFSIATNHSVKNANGEWESKADFFPLVIYGSFAEKMTSYLRKGQKVIIAGFLRQNRWQKDGKKYSETSIGVRSIQLIFDSKKGDAASESLQNMPQEELYSEKNEFSEEQLAEMYASEQELSSDGDIF